MSTSLNNNLSVNIEEKIGKKLREIRIMRGLSQSKLGEMLQAKVTLQQIQKYEKGLNRVSASRLFEIARLLHVSVYYFFEEEEDLPETSIPRKSLISLIKSLESMSPDEKRKFISLAKAVANSNSSVE